MTYLLIPLYLIFTVTGLVLIKIGGASFSFIVENSHFNLSISWQFLLGFMFYGCSFILWTVILQKFDLTYMYPILVGSAYVLVLIAGVLILDEKLTTFNIIGALVILLGLILMNIKK